MRVKELIEQLEKYAKKKGDVMLLEVKIVFPEHGEHSYLNSLKDKDKKMTVKEYVKLCKENYWEAD
ncbi:MAG TPA: hypothetical protein VFW58_11385 [Trichococcus sp.]|nr:hypothetical protein [Trichococcus sp.]